MPRGHLIKILLGKMASKHFVQHLLARWHVATLCDFSLQDDARPRCAVSLGKILHGHFVHFLLCKNHVAILSPSFGKTPLGPFGQHHLARYPSSTLCNISWQDATWPHCPTSLGKMLRGHIVQYLLVRCCMATLCSILAGCQMATLCNS